MAKHEVIECKSRYWDIDNSEQLNLGWLKNEWPSQFPSERQQPINSNGFRRILVSSIHYVISPVGIQLWHLQKVKQLRDNVPLHKVKILIELIVTSKSVVKDFF